MKSRDEAKDEPDKVKLFLLDVEGTIAPVSLVYEQLFPYARVHLVSYLETHGSEAGVLDDLRMLVVENSIETDATAPKFDCSDYWHEAIPYLNWLMDRDRKSTALKSLQGRIWKVGFESDELKGILFQDVPGALARWSSSASVAIYSSGSVAAQLLLLRHSNFGDLTPLISGYFDTRTGAKTVKESYRSIASVMNCRPDEILFFSDSIRELDSAREAGCRTRLVIRAGNPDVDVMHQHKRIWTFDSL